MQEFAVDTICMCTCGKIVANNLAYVMLYGLSTSACTYAYTKVPTYSTLDRNLVRICKILKSAEIDKSGTFREKSRFWRSWRFLARTRILAGFQPGSQIWRIWPNWRFGQVWPDRLSGPARWLAGWTAGLARSGQTCRNLPDGCPDRRNLLPGCYI